MRLGFAIWGVIAVTTPTAILFAYGKDVSTAGVFCIGAVWMLITAGLIACVIVDT